MNNNIHNTLSAIWRLLSRALDGATSIIGALLTGIFSDTTSIDAKMTTLIAKVEELEGGYDYLIGKPTGSVGDFVTTVNALTPNGSITLSDMPASHSLTDFTLYDIEKIERYSSAGVYQETYTLEDTTITYSNPDITLAATVFTAGDTFVIYTNIRTASGSSGSGVADGTLIGVDIGEYSFSAAGKTVTLTAIKNLGIGEILSITNLEDNVKIFDNQVAGSGGSISSNVITLDYDTTTMSDTDELQVLVHYNVELDYDSGTEKTTLFNTPPFHRQSEHLVDEATLDIGKYFKSIEMDTFNTLDISIIAADAGSAAFNLKIYRTQDKDAVVPATGGTAGSTWHDITTDVFGGAIAGVAAIDESEVNVKGSPDRYLIEYEVTAEIADSFDVWYRKYFV